MTPVDPVLAGVVGLRFDAHGMVGLSGPLLALAERIDASFVAAADALGADTLGAERHDFTPLLAVDDLRRVDYFRSFPHLVTLPAGVRDDDDARRRFAGDNPRDGEGPLALRPEDLAPVRAVLAPAACYAVYAALRGARLDAPRVITTRGTCFRREASYAPLRRQGSFRMREVVHLGTAASARAFVSMAREVALELGRAWAVSFELQVATDPFFDPSRSPRHLHQTLFPTKHEMVHRAEGDRALAIGSINAHRSFFGESFSLRTTNEGADVPVHSACLAFGLERWLYAVLAEHGPDPAGWPAGPGSTPPGSR